MAIQTINQNSKDLNNIMRDYIEFRHELIKHCPNCKDPVDELDPGEYCMEHQRFEVLDRFMSELHVCHTCGELYSTYWTWDGEPCYSTWYCPRCVPEDNL